MPSSKACRRACVPLCERLHLTAPHDPTQRRCIDPVRCLAAIRALCAASRQLRRPGAAPGYRRDPQLPRPHAPPLMMRDLLQKFYVEMVTLSGA
ncbi:g851 [Coccomyxa elongata]